MSQRLHPFPYFGARCLLVFVVGVGVALAAGHLPTTALGVSLKIGIWLAFAAAVLGFVAVSRVVPVRAPVRSSEPFRPTAT